MNQIQGLSAVALPFQGVLRVSSASSIALVGLRGRYNERGDFLITTTAPVNESTPATSAELIFPHFAEAGGYTTRFILFSGSAGQLTSGALRLISQSGQSLSLTLWVGKNAAGAGSFIWVRSIDNATPTMLMDTEGADSPFWAPDSRRIAFFSGSSLKVIDTAGGAAHAICTAPTGRGGSWVADGMILFGASTRPIQQVPDTGGVPRPVRFE